MKQKMIMKKAWDISRAAAIRFVGTAKDYIFGKAGALSLAWKHHKETVIKLVGLLGNSKEKRVSIKIVTKWYKQVSSKLSYVVKFACEHLFKRKRIDEASYKAIFNDLYMSI